MKKIILITALAALAACSKQADAPVAVVTEAATAGPDAAAAAPMAADGKPSAGTYKITTSEGKVFTEVDNPDGTYTSSQDGKVVETGKWVQKSPGQFCYTKEEPNPKERCGTEKVDEKGVWTSVNSEGKVSTVVRIGG